VATAGADNRTVDGYRNGAGEAQHIVVNHRPRSSVLLFSRQHPYAKHFVASES
jgi:hypothetical protein